MRNDQVCNLLGVIGCFVAMLSFVCYFFGMSFGLAGTFIGLAIGGFSLINYEDRG